MSVNRPVLARIHYTTLVTTLVTALVVTALVVTALVVTALVVTVCAPKVTVYRTAYRTIFITYPSRIAQERTTRYAVRYKVTFGVRWYPRKVRDTVTTSAVTSAGYELALGSSQTCNIWLPNVV